jgi:hypothetical protein
MQNKGNARNLIGPSPPTERFSEMTVLWRARATESFPLWGRPERNAQIDRFRGATLVSLKIDNTGSSHSHRWRWREKAFVHAASQISGYKKDTPSGPN